jgi:hypothetical protein
MAIIYVKTGATSNGSSKNQVIGSMVKNFKQLILTCLTIGATVSTFSEVHAAIVAPSEFTVTVFPIGTEISGLAISSSGIYGTDLYAAVNGGILRVNPTLGTFTTFTTGLATGSGRPSGLAFDFGIFGTDLLYVSQNNGSVVTVSASGVVNAFSSGGTLSSSNDLAFAQSGSGFRNNLFITNGGDLPFSISQVNISGNNSFFVPTNIFNLPPVGLAFPKTDNSFGTNLFVSLFNRSGLGSSIVQVDPSGNIFAFANNLGLSVDIAFSSGGAFGNYLYVSDPISQSIFKVDSSGISSLFATGFNFTNTGFDADLAFSDDGNTLFIANRNEIIKITSNSSPSTVPEPSTILGIVTLGLGAVLSKKRNQDNSNDS